MQGFLSFQKTEHFAVLDGLEHHTILIVAGNRGGKTADVAQHYFMRHIGACSVEYKNRLMRKVRCISSSLPEGAEEDQDNAQYLEIKKRFPPELLVRDFTSRTKTVVYRKPIGVSSENTVFEFRSSKQEMQDLGKIDISSLWHDEETPKDLREECKMRLMSSGGDEIFTCTVTNPYSYIYDDIYMNAGYVYSSPTIQAVFGYPAEQFHKDANQDIAVIQMATDDNPTLSPEVIERIFDDIPDPEVVKLRRYGVFRQLSGRIHKTYNPRYCYIDLRKLFPGGIPYNWFQARGIDYHDSRLPWSVGWLAASDRDEWFLWKEFHPAIDGPNSYSTYDICKAIARKSTDYYFPLNLIDPLAVRKQPNTLTSVVDDMNRHFHQLRHLEGYGKQSLWEPWDTKGTKGRDEISRRFKNAVRCGRPFNNEVRERGRKTYLPTLWISTECPRFHKSLMQWRYGEFVSQSTRSVNDLNTKPQQKHSHDNMVLECLAKDSRLLNAARFMRNRPPMQNFTPKSVTGR